MSIPWWGYVILAGLAWGTYVPIIFFGGSELGGKANARLMAILCVGIAYFVLAVVFPLALFWMLILFIIAGMKRLHVSAGGAIIGAGLTIICAGAIGIAGYFAGDFLWHQVTEGSIQPKIKPGGTNYRM